MKKEDTIKCSSYRPEELYSIMYRAEQNNAYVVYIRGDLCPTVKDFFREISSAMRFPYYFGWNWAALDECITDLEWLKFTCILLVIDQKDSLFLNEDSPEELVSTLIKYLGLAVEYWKSQNITMDVYLNQLRQDNYHTVR